MLQGPAYDASCRDALIAQLNEALARWPYRENYPWITLIDSATDAFPSGAAQNTLRDFLWLTFTRSDPAKDIFGYNERTHEKHWGCDAPMIVDARIKPHHQKALTLSDDIRNRARQILIEENILTEDR
jgi:4-hydroxy-3-polyprenylbenzoate decarboxylase